MNAIQIPLATTYLASPTPANAAGGPPQADSTSPLPVDVMEPQKLTAATTAPVEKPKAPLVAKILGGATAGLVGAQVGGMVGGPIGSLVLGYMGVNYGTELGGELGTKRAVLVAALTVAGGMAAQALMGPTGFAMGAPIAFVAAESLAKSL